MSNTPYTLAKESYASLGVDTEAVFATLALRRSPALAGRETTSAVLKNQMQCSPARHSGHWQLPRESPDDRRIAR